jgi:hypothetical protein
MKCKVVFINNDTLLRMMRLTISNNTLFLHYAVGQMRNAYKFLVGKSEGKRQLIRCRHRWEDNIKMGLREI